MDKQEAEIHIFKAGEGGEPESQAKLRMRGESEMYYIFGNKLLLW